MHAAPSEKIVHRLGTKGGGVGAGTAATCSARWPAALSMLCMMVIMTHTCICGVQLAYRLPRDGALVDALSTPDAVTVWRPSASLLPLPNRACGKRECYFALLLCWCLTHPVQCPDTAAFRVTWWLHSAKFVLAT